MTVDIPIDQNISADGLERDMSFHATCVAATLKCDVAHAYALLQARVRELRGEPEPSAEPVTSDAPAESEPESEPEHDATDPVNVLVDGPEETS